jgi:hypothetical protein
VKLPRSIYEGAREMARDRKTMGGAALHAHPEEDQDNTLRASQTLRTLLCFWLAACCTEVVEIQSTTPLLLTVLKQLMGNQFRFPLIQPQLIWKTSALVDFAWWA